MIQSFEIEGRLDGLNEYTRKCRSHKMAGAEAKKQNQMVVEEAIEKAGLRPVGEVGSFVGVTFYEAPKRKGSRRRDFDNIMFAVKFILDALVAKGVLVDDDLDHVLHVSTSVRKASYEEGSSVFVTIAPEMDVVE